MCGFAGFLTDDHVRLGNLEALSTRMALAIRHRGPDDAGRMRRPVLRWHIGACLFLISLRPTTSRWRRLAGGRLVFLIENIY